MGFLSWLTGSKRTSAAPSPTAGRTLTELAQRLKLDEKQLAAIPITYQEFQIPKGLKPPKNKYQNLRARATQP